MAVSQKLYRFVTMRFTRVGEKNPRMNRWKTKCNYYIPDLVVEHRESGCMEHLFEYELCPSVPEPVWKEALTRIATKRDILSFTSTDRLEIRNQVEAEGYECICGPWALNEQAR